MFDCYGCRRVPLEATEGPFSTTIAGDEDNLDAPLCRLDTVPIGTEARHITLTESHRLRWILH